MITCGIFGGKCRYFHYEPGVKSTPKMKIYLSIYLNHLIVELLEIYYFYKI